MEHKPLQETIINYAMHLADNQAKMVESQTRMAEALDKITTTLVESETRRTAADLRIAEILAASQEKIAASETRTAEAYVELGRILDRVIQTTDRTEQMTARLLASLAPEKVSH